MPEPQGGPDGLESMAFQLLLHKITGLEHAMQSLPPLLKKIIDQLEAQHKQPEVPIATYAQLYPEWQEEDAEAQVPPEQPVPDTVEERTCAPPQRPRRFWRWFLKET
jgi:hypothetical protein